MDVCGVKRCVCEPLWQLAVHPPLPGLQLLGLHTQHRAGAASVLFVGQGAGLGGEPLAQVVVVGAGPLSAQAHKAVERAGGHPQRGHEGAVLVGHVKAVEPIKVGKL